MHREFERIYGDWYMPSPWFTYRTVLGWRYCQPDGLLFRPDGRVIICEAKLAHTSKAYGQLSTLYRPIIEALLPAWNVCLLEVVRFYRSPEVMKFGFPVPVRLVEQATEAIEDTFCVMILKDTRVKDGER